MALLGAANLAQAAVPPVAPTFPNDPTDDFTFIPGQLLALHRYGSGNDRPTNIIYHNGYIYTNMVGGGGRREFTFTGNQGTTSPAPGDVTKNADPSAFTLYWTGKDNNEVPLINDQGNHAHTKVGDWTGGQYDLAIQRIGLHENGLGNAYRIPSDETFRPGRPAGHTGGLIRLYYPWTVAFNWAYGSHNGQTFIYKGDELLANWNALNEHGVSGTTILMGDLCFIISDQSQTGVLAYDMSPIFQDPPGPPQLLDKLSGDFGAYLPVLYENYIIFARNNGDSLVDIVDWSDPTDLRFVTSVDLTRDSSIDGPGNVPYVQCQDNFIFARHHKVNMDTFEVVLRLDQTGTRRPAGSLTDQLETSQYLMPMGRFLVSGSYSFDQYDGMGVWVHQAEADTKAPYVGYHRPRPEQTNFPLGAPISLLIHETLESYTIINGETILVRPVGGSPIDCWISFSHDDVLTITPKEDLSPDTTYEVIVVDGGIKDAAGNGIEGYSFTFSTGSAVSGGNRTPEILDTLVDTSPLEPGESVTFTADATDDENDPLEYRYTFGDGTEATDWTTDTSVSHTYTEAGHFDVKIQVRDTKPGGANSVRVETLTVTVTDIPTGPFPTNSGPIALDQTNRRVFVANPDNDTVTAIDADTLERLWEVPVSPDPRSVTVDSGGKVWVACYDEGYIDVLAGADGSLLTSLDAGYGSAPVGAAATPDGSQVFITLEGYGDLVRFNATSMAEEARITLGPWAHAIAISGDGQSVFVSRFISPRHFGIVWEVSNNPGGLSLSDTIELWRDRGDRGKDGASAGSGVPNYIASLTITPDGEWLWYTSKKDDEQRGEFFDQGTGNNSPLTPDHTVRAMVGRIDLSNNQEPGVSGESDDHIRLDVDNAEGANAVAFSQLGDWAFVAMRGNNLAAVYDRLHLQAGGSENTFARFSAGEAPTGALVDPVTERLWVKNFMSRDVTVRELAAFFATGERTELLTTVPTVSNEQLSEQVLLGKQIFYNAGNQGDANSIDRMSLEAYMSCASCHIDGSLDGSTYDFTQRGEGFRNTTDLRGRSGMGHGNVHWSANFDEIQDFENDIRLHFGGAGFMEDEDFAATQDPLGAPKSGLSSELDAMAAYITSLDRTHLPQSPYRNPDGTLTADALAGAALFAQENCSSCHDPDFEYTDSTGGIGIAPTLHNVGTLRTSSGNRLDAVLTGIDSPSLLGIWQTGPYFHDGSAQTLEDVFVVAGGEMYQAENATLNGASIPGFIDINQDGACHGEQVGIDPGDTVVFSAIDGGSGGTGALEFRCTTRRSGVTMTVNVNGTNYNVPIEQNVTRLEWNQYRIEGVQLNAGANNTITVGASGDDFALDDMVVSTPDILALAQPHRRVLDLTQNEQNQMLAYLLQLDGRDASGDIVPVPEPLPPVAPPTPPSGFAASATGFDSIEVSWTDASTDENEWIIQFREQGTGTWYEAGVLGRAGSGTVVTVTLTGLKGGTTYEARVFARNGQGDSAPTSIAQASTGTAPPPEAPGVFVEYFDIGGLNVLPDFDALTADLTGDQANFNLDFISDQGLSNDGFAFRFTGLIEIDVAGTYTFFTSSDDGSKLFINGTEVVDNDGLHGTQEESGQITLDAGKHAIEVQHFESAGGESLTVRYEGNSLPKQLIPDNKLSHLTAGGAVPGTPMTPAGLVLSRASTTSVDVSFTDMSANETGFRLFYREAGSGLFNLMELPSADGTGDAVATTLIGLDPGMTYEVRVQARNGNADSPYTPFATLSLSPFSAWQLAHFTPAEIDAGMAEPGARSDGGPFTNLEQFFYGMDPRVVDMPHQGFSIEVSGDNVLLRVARAKEAGNVALSVHASTVAETSAFSEVDPADYTMRPPAAVAGRDDLEELTIEMHNPPFSVSAEQARFFYLVLRLSVPDGG